MAKRALGLILTPGEIRAQTGNFNYRNGFDDGAGVYAGTLDASIQAAAPDTNSNNEPYLWVDGPPPTQQLLIRFDDIVGTAPGQLAPSSLIASAELVLVTTSSPDSGSANHHSVRRLLQPWNASTITWNNSFGGDGIQADDSEASADVLDTTLSVGVDSTIHIDVTDAVQSWVSGEPNYGLVVLPGGGDGLAILTSEDVGLGKRPLLEIVSCSEDSYADEVHAFNPNVVDGEPSVMVLDPDAALGPPDHPPTGCDIASGSCNYVSLGTGGSITLRFSDNFLTGSGDSAIDLYIFEIGDQVEDTFVEISSDGVAWEDIGKVAGSTSYIDIDSFGFGPESSFSFVRLTDDPSEGHISGSTAGADIDAVCALSSSGVPSPPSPGPVVNENHKLYASDASAGDSFGRSVAIQDNFVLVGAPNRDDFVEGEWVPGLGAAYLYVRDEDDGWVVRSKLTAFDDTAGSLGISVAIRGGMAFAGAPGVGAVYVFKQNVAGDWPHFQKITTPVDDLTVDFGRSLAVSGNTLLVGADGRAYVFTLGVNPTRWLLTEELDSGVPGTHDGFGLDVAIDGDFAVVGALRDDFLGGDTGVAYVFARNSEDEWPLQALLRPGDIASGDQFGHAVAISGSSIFVSAVRYDLGIGWGGQAYVYDRVDDAWTLNTSLQAVDESSSVEFGWSVALRNNIALAGDRSYPSGIDKGAVYLFVRDALGVWSKHSTLRASDAEASDYLGFDIAISGNTVVVGANGDDDRAVQAGAAYIFEMEDLPVPTDIPEILTGPLSHTLLYGESLALSVVATSSDVLSYQWRKDGVDIPGATDSTLPLLDVDRSASGIYSVAVSNSAGSAQSTEAVLRVRVPQRLEPPEPVGGGFILLRSGDHDGYALQDADKDYFIVQESTDLVQWMTVTPEKKYVETGKVTFIIPSPGITQNETFSARSLRVIEEAASGGP